MELTPVTQDLSKVSEFWYVESKRHNDGSTTTTCKISREIIYEASHQLGFCLYNGELYQILGRVLYPRTLRQYQDILKGVIPRKTNHYETIANAYEQFIQTKGEFTITRLQIIQRDILLNDTREVCYKFFRNCFIKITGDSVPEQYTYDQLPDNILILSTKIQPRDYQYHAGGKYIEFLQLATQWAAQQDYVKRVIGYLSHEWKDETTGYIIVQTEQVADPKDGGGAGKNLFVSLMQYTTTYHSKNGKQAKFDEKFFQSWNGQRIMCISEVPKNFPFEFLKEPSTGTFILKKLFKDEIEIPNEDGPKFVVNTQFSYEISDGGLKRRIIPLEFTDYFTRAGGVDVHFGCHFPSGWTDQDWNGFDTMIIDSVRLWLGSGRKLKAVELSETGWQKQFEYTYHKNLFSFISDNFQKWVDTKQVPSEEIQNSLKIFYHENDIPLQFKWSANKVADAITAYGQHHNIKVTPNKQVWSLGINSKCYLFESI